MKDIDLIKKIKSVDGEKLKIAIIEELNIQRNSPAGYGQWWNAYRSCLYNALRRMDKNWRLA